jgi:predicted 3-demethylubiquinone-9 3-methyltransferase (glyoxalase superfamily)
MTRSVATFLMFEGVAEEATNLYVSLFERSEIRRMERWSAGEPGRQGSVKRAEFVLAGHDLIAIDSPVKHAFTFTPSMSLYVECDTEAELDHAYEVLSAGGQVLMERASYGFSKKFGWINDRFGVSWQLNWA